MRKILVVDDEPLILENWLDFFKDTSHPVEVHTAENVEDALKLVAAVPKYDLFITDYKMPKQTGMDFVLKLRSMPNYKETPVFFFSAYIPEFEISAKILDNVMLLNKPMNFDYVRNQVAIFLKVKVY